MNTMLDQLNGLVHAANGFLGMTGDGRVNVKRLGEKVVLTAPLAPGLGARAFAVLVEKDGGVVGGAAAECTWTYTVKALTGETLGEALLPQVPRLHYVGYWYAGETRTTPAETTSVYGLAAYDNGTLVLLQAFGELAKDTVCP